MGPTPLFEIAHTIVIARLSIPSHSTPLLSQSPLSPYGKLNSPIFPHTSKLPLSQLVSFSIVYDASFLLG
ncbi:hypothetical protein AAHA92_07538 [Salvia divinorum]|uniref:Uncharacterized protein n=1 Tax=Salvia divinorum TaxID=28513 RepID=A0ABD1I9A8_SALDI